MMTETAQAGGKENVFLHEGKPVTVVRYEAKVKMFNSGEIASMQRPSAHSFESDTPEFYRWFEYGGKERDRPLDKSELKEFLEKERLHTKEDAELSVEMYSSARDGDKQLWDHLINEKRHPSPLGREAMIESIDLRLRDGTTIVATRDNLSSEEAELVVGVENMKRIKTQIDGELMKLQEIVPALDVKGRLEGDQLAEKEAVSWEDKERQAAARIEQRSIDYTDAYVAAKAPSLAALPAGDNAAKLAELNKNDVDPYSSEQIEQWVKDDVRDASMLFIRDSDRYEDAALSMANSMRDSAAYKAQVHEIAPDMAKIVTQLDHENNLRIEEKEIRKSLEVREISIEKDVLQENAIVRGTDPEIEETIAYVATVLLNDGTTQHFGFDAEAGIEGDDLKYEAGKIWNKIAQTRAAHEAALLLEKSQAQTTLRHNNENVSKEEEKAAAGPDKEGGEVQDKNGADVDRSSAVPEKIQKRFLHVDGKYYFPDEKLAFSDIGNKLRAHEEHHEVVNALVDIAKARGWESMTVRGSEEFRKQVWFRASTLGIEVAGYKPTEVEKAHLAAQLEKMGKSQSKTPAATVNEIEKGIVKEQEKEGAHVKAEGKSNVVPLRHYEGQLLDHGTAPYQFDKNEKKNYFVKLLNDKNEEKVVWGVDLERAIAESGAQTGEKIALNFMGKQAVEVMVNVKDDKGNVVGQEPAIKDRNTWNVERAEAFRTKDAQEVVKDHPDLAPAYGTVAVARKFAEQNFKPEDQERFVAGVKGVLEKKIAMGQAVPAPRIMSRDQAQEQAMEVGERSGRRSKSAEEMER